MSDIDWSKAPDGAQCYVEGWGFFKCDNGEWWVSQGGIWQRTPYKSPENFSWFGAAIWRGKEWTGTGLPPVGTVCEMTHENWGNRGWEKVTIKYCSAEYAITTDGHGEQHWHIRNVTFRPIKTQAQIEAESREAAIQKMRDCLEIDEAYNISAIMEALYDNGYRLTKQDG